MVHWELPFISPDCLQNPLYFVQKHTNHTCIFIIQEGVVTTWFCLTAQPPLGFLLCFFCVHVLFFFKYCGPFEISSLEPKDCMMHLPTVLSHFMSSRSLGGFSLSVLSSLQFPRAHKGRWCNGRMLHHDSATATTAMSTAVLTVHRLPSDVLRACSTANTAFVWLVGISTLQIMPSQQETHSWGGKGDHWTQGNSAAASRDARSARWLQRTVN